MCGLLFLGSPLFSADPAPVEELKLTKPIVMIYLKGDTNIVYVIERPFFAEVKGKTLLVGTGAKWNVSTWEHGLSIWLDWHAVQSLIQFDSLEQVHERFNRP
jgi:hypothetical protein